MDATGGLQVVDIGRLVGGRHRRLVHIYGKEVLVCISSKTRPNQGNKIAIIKNK